jgi:hypothetical protein
MLGFDKYGFDKKSIGMHYAKHVFLHLVGSAGHVVHSGVSGARNIDTLFFMLGWDWYRLQKRLTGTHCTKHVFLHPVESTGYVVHFWCIRGT